MRITTGMIMEQYNSTLTDNLQNLNDSFSQISTQKKFTRASDDPGAAMKALRSLHNLSSTQQVGDSINEASSWMNNTESTVSTVKSIVQKAQETLIAANNSGTMSQSDCNTYATTLQSLQDELTQTLNSTFNGRYVFGGSEDGPQPFKVDTTTGKLQYYDYNAKLNATPQYVDYDSITAVNKADMPLSYPVDVGLGMKVATKVEPGTAFESATSGIDMLGLSSGGSVSTFDVLQNAIDKLKASASTGTKADLSDEITNINTSLNNVLNTTTIIGQKTNMLNFLSDKNSTDITNQESRISSLEDVDITKAITQYETKEMVYRSALQVGTKIIQQTLFDFMK